MRNKLTASHDGRIHEAMQISVSWFYGTISNG